MQSLVLLALGEADDAGLARVLVHLLLVHRPGEAVLRPALVASLLEGVLGGHREALELRDGSGVHRVLEDDCAAHLGATVFDGEGAATEAVKHQRVGPHDVVGDLRVDLRKSRCDDTNQIDRDGVAHGV